MDVVQIVFSDLARQAKTMSKRIMLGGWLYQHTVFVAANCVRAERRREARERLAIELMQSEVNPMWDQVALVLDDAILQLNEQDRIAIVLRFLEGRDLATVGRSLGVSPDAAQKRVTRALDRLRALLQQKGVSLPTSALS